MFRFAPSTTQDLNIETLQVALFNYIVSSQQNDKLHINMKDTNTEKNIDGKDQEILEILALFGIKWSEVSYQSHNLKFHQQLATKLLMDKNAFSCFCSKSLNDKPYDGTCENLSDEEVLNNEKPFSIRLRQPDKDISFEDKIQGKVTFEKSSIDSFVILNVDKTATQDFASAIDDMLTDISLVIQNKDQLSNTPKQILIRDYLGYDKTIEYAHLPTILDAPSLIWLLEEGFLPSAITNYLILIANQTPKEIFTLDEAKEWFNLDNVSSSPSRFDLNKLREINKEHIKNLPSMELAKFIGFSSSDLGELAKIYAQKDSTINEIKPKIDAIFSKKEPTEFQEEFKILHTLAKNAPFFKEYDKFKNYLLQESGLKEKDLYKPLRFLLTGMVNDGPDLKDIYPHIKNYLGEIIR